MKSVTKFLKCIFLQFFFLVFCWAQKTAPIVIQDLQDYVGKNITVYAVSATNFIGGTTPTISKVFAIIAEKKITDKDFRIEPYAYSEHWTDSFLKPNYLVVVIHEQAEHALNRLPLPVGPFEAPEFDVNVKKVAMTSETRKYLLKKSFSFKYDDVAPLQLSINQ